MLNSDVGAPVKFLPVLSTYPGLRMANTGIGVSFDPNDMTRSVEVYYLTSTSKFFQYYDFLTLSFPRM